MRSIKKIHTAESRPIADLKTYSPLPTRQLQQIDPFIFLNHHGPQVYPANNNGLPFGPHPHRGMQTVTFVLDGDVAHKDSNGNESVVTDGGIQWMVAGSGLIHSEVSSTSFKEKGGFLEILQLWINLKAIHKMTKPFYKEFQKDKIPFVKLAPGVNVQAVAGNWNNIQGAYEPLTEVKLGLLHFDENATLDLIEAVNRNIFFYVIRGKVNVNGESVNSLNLVEFNNDETLLKITSVTECIILYGSAVPFNEPVVAQGPFVMNTENEIYQAYEDYRNGKFGEWKD